MNKIKILEVAHSKDTISVKYEEGMNIKHIAVTGDTNHLSFSVAGNVDTDISKVESFGNITSLTSYDAINDYLLNNPLSEEDKLVGYMMNLYDMNTDEDNTLIEDYINGTKGKYVDEILKEIN